MGKDTTRFDKSLVSMFGYIDNNKEKTHKMAKDVLSPVLGRPADELEDLLLFQYIDECTKKIKAFLEAGVNSIHFWPVNNYIEQIEIFSKEIICAFSRPYTMGGSGLLTEQDIKNIQQLSIPAILKLIVKVFSKEIKCYKRGLSI